MRTTAPAGSWQLRAILLASFSLLLILLHKMAVPEQLRRRLSSTADFSNNDEILIQFPNGCKGLVHVSSKGFSHVSLLRGCKPCDTATLPPAGTGSEPSSQPIIMPPTKKPTPRKPPTNHPTHRSKAPTAVPTKQPTPKPTQRTKHPTVKRTPRPTPRHTPRPTCAPTETKHQHILHMAQRAYEENTSFRIQNLDSTLDTFHLAGFAQSNNNGETVIPIIFANGCKGTLTIAADNKSAQIQYDACVPCAPPTHEKPTRAPHPTPHPHHKRPKPKKTSAPTEQPTWEPTPRHTRKPTKRHTPPPTPKHTHRPTCGCADDLVNTAERSAFSNSSSGLRP